MSASFRRVWGLLALAIGLGLLSGAAGCGNKNIEEGLQNMRKPVDPLPGEEPYQTAIRNFLVKDLREPEFEIEKWHAPLKNREGLAVTVEFYEKLPNKSTRVLRKRVFIYTKKGEVRSISATN